MDGVATDRRCIFTLPSGERCWLPQEKHTWPTMEPPEGFPPHVWQAPDPPMRLRPPLLDVPTRQVLRATIWEKTHPDAVIPHYEHEGDLGFDLSIVEGSVVPPGQSARFPIGLRAALPPGIAVWITSRSSTFDRGWDVIDGKIDSGYRGEWFARVKNNLGIPNRADPGDRLVQGIALEVLTLRMVEGKVDVDGTTRGAGGFGSTGLKHGA